MLLGSLLPIITFPDLLGFCDSTSVVGLCSPRSAYQCCLAPVTLCVSFTFSLFLSLSIFKQLGTFDVCGHGLSRVEVSPGTLLLTVFHH